MRALLVGIAALAWSSTGFASEDRFHLSAGAGLPTLLHGELGVYLTPHWSVEARAANTLFNPVVGGGVTYLVGHPYDDGIPRHALLLGMHALVNPTLGSLKLHSAGDTIGAYLLPSVGYGFHARSGLTLQARVGAIVTRENSDDAPLPSPPEQDYTNEQSYTTFERARVGARFAGGPDVTLSVGWAF